VDAAVELFRLVNAYRVSQAIHVAATLRLSDHLAGGPLSVSELATAAGCDEGALYRLMRALSAAGVYDELPEGRFAVTALGDELRSDHVLAGWARFVGRPHTWQAWGALEHSVRTGENAFTAVHGQSPRVLVLTMFDNDESLFTAMRAGARGYLVKGAEQEQIVRAIHAVAAGEVVFGAGCGQPRAGIFLRRADRRPSRPAVPRVDRPGDRGTAPGRAGVQQHRDRPAAVSVGEDGPQPHLERVHQTADPGPGTGDRTGTPGRPG
jgi:hypothetical protein